MSLWSRVANVFRGNRLSSEIDEELQTHLDDAVAEGRDPSEARRALGSPLHWREESRDAKLLPWLDSLRADAVFGWRQLLKRKVASAAAILTLALAIGSCTSAFRLIDALLFRPMPVADPQSLYSLYREGIGFDGKPQTFDGWAYPSFARMRAAVADRAELFAVSFAELTDLTYGGDQEMEKVRLNYVSGGIFDSFQLRPAAGRLLTANDDREPGAHPYAVLSYDYWDRRFARDPQVVGRTFRMAGRIYEIVGVGPRPFTGTETGFVTDVFLPAMMNSGVLRDDNTWHRTLLRLKPGVAAEPVRAALHATSRAFELERAKGFTGMTRQSIDHFIDQTLRLEPAAAGASGLQKDYRRSLLSLGVLVALVLLIACINVANLLTAQASARAREMALRVSIGAGSGRLVQLVLVESAILAFVAASLGAVFAAWSAPFVVSRISSQEEPVRLALAADWRVLSFGLALTVAVTFLFGLAPALRALSIAPASALKGGSDPHARRRSMHALIAVQVAFCALVLFVAGLFSTSFQQLSTQPPGFSTERILVVSAAAETPRQPVYWDQAADSLREIPGVEKVALAGWPLLTPNGWNGFVSVNGAPPGPVLAYFLAVSPGWIDTMKVTLVNGADFRPSDTSPGSAIVNETFVRQFFPNENPLGKPFAKGKSRYQIVGVTKDAAYRHIREEILPVAYVPFHQLDSAGAPQPVRRAAFLMRTRSANPLALASVVRRALPAARPEFRVSNITTQAELFRTQTLRERLLAMLALFFAVVASLLAGVGLYGVLDYSVLQRRREIGIRMAIGAPSSDIARRVTVDALAMVLAGGVAGLGLGLASVRYIMPLLYHVKTTDPATLALPCLMICGVSAIAALLPVIRALRIAPVTILRSE